MSKKLIQLSIVGATALALSPFITKDVEASSSEGIEVQTLNNIEVRRDILTGNYYTAGKVGKAADGVDSLFEGGATLQKGEGINFNVITENPAEISVSPDELVQVDYVRTNSFRKYRDDINALEYLSDNKKESYVEELRSSKTDDHESVLDKAKQENNDAKEAAEAEAARIEQERQEAEAARIEQERQEAEAARIEQERQEAAEAERAAAEERERQSAQNQTTESTQSSNSTTVRQTSANQTPAQQATVPASTSGSGIVNTARQYLGTPYRWGGSTPAGFDCSGFVQWVFAQHGKSLGRTSRAQSVGGTQIPLSQAQPGDVLIWGGANPYHTGIYIGNNQYIHSPKPGDVVKIATMYSFTPSHAVRY